MPLPYAYATAMQAATPLLHAVLRNRLNRGKEDPQRLQERRGEPTQARPQGKLVWFHAASVGESLSVLPIITELLARSPASVHVLLTTGTRSSASLLASAMPPRSLHQFAPVDHPSWVARFLDHWRPDAAIWVESELWPNMVTQTHARNIPMALLNARLSERSAQRWQRFAGDFARRLFGSFDLILAQDQACQERLERYNLAKVRGAANLKHLFGASLGVSTKDMARLALLENCPHRWLAASTHPGEERLALEASAAVKQHFPDLVTVLAPRHMERLPDIEQLVAAVGRSSVRLSQLSPSKLSTPPDFDIVIIDSMGLLPTLYQTIPLSFVGGSMNLGLGGHNVFEPLRAGSCILFGPDMANFRSISDALLDQGAAVQIGDTHELAQQLKRLLSDPEARATMVQRAEPWVSQNQEQQRYVLDCVLNLVNGRNDVLQDQSRPQLP